MTRLNLLEDQKAILTANKELLEEKRRDIYVREQKALGDALAGFYGVFPEDVEVEVTRGSVYFKMAHPEYQALLKGLQAAVEKAEELRWKLIAAQARVDVWRSQEASNRTMDRVTQ